MLKNKLNQFEYRKDKPIMATSSNTTDPSQSVNDDLQSPAKKGRKSQEYVEIDGTVSSLFAVPFWKQFYDIEKSLNDTLRPLQPPAFITCTYNPVEYAAELHCAYLAKFLKGQKKLVFIGMNPGPNGMAQNGVPFGDIGVVRNMMQLTGTVQQPPKLHNKRPIDGMQCTKKEPSGERFWNLLKEAANGSLLTFSEQCFVHNFCPLAFFDKLGKNITPSELKGDYKTSIRDICLSTCDKLLDLLQPEIVVAVGRYVHDCLQKSIHKDRIKIILLPHPSPRTVNNHDWPEKARKFLVEQDLLKYIQNANKN